MMNDYPILFFLALLLTLFSFFLISQIFSIKKELRKLSNIVKHLLKEDKKKR